MRRLILFALLGTTLLFCSGCQTYSDISEAAAKGRAYLDTIDEKIKAGDAKIEELQAEMAAERQKLATIGIVVDKNGDGEITIAESAEAAKDLALGAVTDADKRQAAFDWKVWAGILSGPLAGFGLSTAASRNRRRLQKEAVVNTG